MIGGVAEGRFNKALTYSDSNSKSSDGVSSIDWRNVDIIVALLFLLLMFCDVLLPRQRLELEYFLTDMTITAGTATRVSISCLLQSLLRFLTCERIGYFSDLLRELLYPGNEAWHVYFLCRVNLFTIVSIIMNRSINIHGK